MNIKTYLTFVLLILIYAGTNAQTKIENGILDLRYEGVPDSPIELTGDWEFYWDQHYLPADFENLKELQPDLFIKVPSYWTEFDSELPEITSTGYATYRLTILLPVSFRNEVGFKIPIFDSSYRIYFNGKYVNANGVPGTTIETTKPEYDPSEYYFKPAGNRIEIIVNVSNFHHRRGGFWLPIEFGKRGDLELEIKRKEILRSITDGMLLAFAGFFFLLYLMFKKERSILHFSLATLSIFTRSLFTGNYDILYFFDVNWSWIIKMEYISSYLALIFALWYFYHIYKDNIIPWINTAITVVFALAISLVIVAPVSIFSYSILLYMPVVVIMLLYYMVRSIMAAIKERGYKIITLVGFLILTLGIGNDILHSSGYRSISSEYIMSYTMAFFLMTQVTILIYRWVLSAREEKRLLAEIEYVNRNLENIVIERTTELTNQKSELEIQKKEADKQNSELEKTISVKNRIFSIIAHDLKSPVLNLSLMIDHLKDNNDPEVQSSVISSISQQAGFATNLIENLLIWGEGQQNKISYNPAHVSLTDLVLESFNLLSEPSERKMIKMTYSHKGNPVAICDKDLINIVLRNTLSNSIKFTRSRGLISVMVEEPAVRDGKVYIRIKDNGVGIPPDKLARILGDGIVDSTPGTNNEKGTGLGLQLCADLVRINKGSISISSEVDKGTTITIMLPSPTRNL